MVALDISNSMLAQDSRPDRLGRAKLEVMDLMNHLGGDEVGLVLFSGASFIQFPLTFDYSTARSFLDRANPSLISRPGTAIGSAIDTAPGRLRSAEGQPKGDHNNDRWRGPRR